MKLILLSGGSGKRLWPLSNDARSKQFLRLLKHNGQNESMVQRVWRQLKQAQLSTCSLIITSRSQSDILKSQLGENIPLVVEPERRDTFPAISLATCYLTSEKMVDPNEVIVVLPVDPYVEQSFFEKVKELEHALIVSKADLALLGVIPTHPSEKYGYIVPVSNSFENGPFIQVSHFKEKPTEEFAKGLIKQNALWNCGVFAFKAKFLLSIIEKLNISTGFSDLSNNYRDLPKISFDYQVVEKTKKIIAMSYDGYWKDLGTWNTLTDEMSDHVIGKGVVSKESTNTHLINELDIPVTVMGGKNLIVAASPDGILVSDKALSPKLKDIVSEFNQKPMYEEKQWGFYKVLDYSNFTDEIQSRTRKVVVYSGKNLSYHYHLHRSEIWTILNGEGIVVIDGIEYQVKSSDVYVIPKGVKHSIKALSQLEIIETQTGIIFDEDIHRLCLQWSEISNNH